PQLECLEDRLTPTIMVNTTIDELTPGDGKVSLREAINKANIHTGADIIVLPAGVFKIALTGAGENDNKSGDFDVTDSLTLQGQAPGMTIIDGARLDRLFDLVGSISVNFSGLTLRNGGSTSVNGGAIQALSADVHLNGCAVNGNLALKGGGINDESGDV